ncbi:MAG: (2Fe-2S) ferredoxin domain-containing protein [bacterium]|nr:(2Fe-2S) ferredoxin domain-containing protein [bacterium]
MSKPERHVFVCLNSRPPEHPKGSCIGRDGEDVFLALRDEFDEKELHEKARITRTGCMGPCRLGPIVVVYPEATWYHGVTVADVPEIVAEHIIGGKPVTRLAIPDEAWD